MPANQVVAFTLALLKSELLNDPAGLGYASHIPTDDITGLQALINSKTGPGSGTEPHDPITGAALLAAINPPDLNNLTIANSQNLQLYTSAASVAIGSSALQVWLTGLFTSGQSAVTNAAIVALATQQASRAELLWGSDTLVTGNQIEDALHS